MLTTDTEAPVVTETTVSADLLQALEIVTELAVDTVGEYLAVLAIDDIALPVEEPAGDLVCAMSETVMKPEYSAQHTLERVLDDGDDALKLFGGEVTGALAEIDIGLLADQVGVSATDTLDLGQGVHDLLLAIDVRVQQTDDVLEAGRVSTTIPGRQLQPMLSAPHSQHDASASYKPIPDPQACCRSVMVPLRLFLYGNQRSFCHNQFSTI